MSAEETHNRLAPRIVTEIAGSGGSPQDVMTLLESVVVGVVVFVSMNTTGMKSTDDIIDMMVPDLKARAAEIVASYPVAGRA